MKTIKHIVITSFLLLTFNFVNAQNPFHGTWEWQNGNQIFRATLWGTTNGATKGHFEMVEVNSGVETVIYTSDKPYNSNMTQHWHPVINVVLNSYNISLDGRILDNSYDYEDPSFDPYDMCESWLRMEIITTSPTTATWKVNYYDIIPDNAPPINIPTNIVMTKQ